MLDVRILGRPPNDNALLVLADSGQSCTRMMFDCGADTLADVPLGEIQAIDHLFLSHLHMDHISGFDAFFRVNFQRCNRENHIWGPKGTASILQHRFQGFWWSHASELNSQWLVHDVDEATVQSWRFEANEAFAVMHDAGRRAYQRVILETREAKVSAIPLKHHGLCMGYAVREVDRYSIDTAALDRLGLKPGPWIAELKAGISGPINLGETTHDADALRAQVMQCQRGDSFAYLTDFLADEEQRPRIAPHLTGIKTLYAEAQYAADDGALAEKYHHSTIDQIAALAALAGVERYTMLHLSRRYSPVQWRDMLKCAQSVFANTGFPVDWGIA